MAQRERERIAVFLNEYAASTIRELPTLCSEFRASASDVERLAPVTASGARSLERLAQRLPQLGELDEVLPDFDLAEELLEAKLGFLERLHRRWRDAWHSVANAVSHVGGALRRRLRNLSDALLKGLNAFLGSLKDALNAAPGLGAEALAAHVGKEAKEFGEAALAGTKR